MACIDELILARFPAYSASQDGAQIAVAILDVGMMQAGKMVETIHDLVVHPHAGIDVDAVAAASLSLLAFLGQLGGIVDDIETYTRTIASPHAKAA